MEKDHSKTGLFMQARPFENRAKQDGFNQFGLTLKIFDIQWQVMHYSKMSDISDKFIQNYLCTQLSEITLDFEKLEKEL